jgi:hypothetical protein
LSDFERGQIIGAFNCSIFEEIAFLLVISRATVSKVMSAYTYHGKTVSSKRNSEQKLTLTEKHCRILRKTVLKNHRTAAAWVTAEQICIHLEDPVSTKTV